MAAYGTHLSRHPVALFYLIAWLIPLALFAMLYFWPAPLEALNGSTFDPGTLLSEALTATGHRDIDLVSLVPMIQHSPAVVVVLLYAAAPSLAALIAVSWLYGKPGLLGLCRRLNPLPEGVAQGITGYGLMLLGMAAVIAFGLALSASIGKGTQVAIANMAAVPVFGLGGWILYATLLDEGGSLEELGWRGFAQPVLADRLSNPLIAALIIGTLWSLWHLPIRLTSPYIMNASIPWAGYLTILWVSEVGVSVIAGYLVNRSGGSVWPAIMVHGFSNNMNASFANQDTPVIDGVYTVSTGLAFRCGTSVTVALLIVLLAGSRLGLKAKQQ